MTKLNKLSLALALTTGVLVGPAHAFSLADLSSYAGNYTMTFKLVDSGTTAYYGELPEPVVSGTTYQFCSTADECDDIGSVSTYQDANGNYEDSWGVIQVQSIATSAGTWYAGNNGQYLTGIFYGLVDIDVSFESNTKLGTTTNTLTAYSTGGSLDLWLNNQDVIPTGDIETGTAPGDRIGQSGFAGITDVGGSLWLAMAIDGVSTFYEYAGDTVVDQNGNISGGNLSLEFLDVTGGSVADQYDTNSRDQGNDMTFSLENQCGVTVESGFVPVCGNWTVVGAGTAQGAKIPEPATLALLGLGLIGLASMRRRA